MKEQHDHSKEVMEEASKRFDELEKAKEYDFYFSAEQQRRRYQLGIGPVFLKGKEYTEIVEKGKKPYANFDDFVLVGTGTKDDIDKNEVIRV